MMKYKIKQFSNNCITYETFSNFIYNSTYEPNEYIIILQDVQLKVGIMTWHFNFNVLVLLDIFSKVIFKMIRFSKLDIDWIKR